MYSGFNPRMGRCWKKAQREGLSKESARDFTAGEAGEEAPKRLERNSNAVRKGQFRYPVSRHQKKKIWKGQK